MSIYYKVGDIVRLNSDYILRTHDFNSKLSHYFKPNRNYGEIIKVNMQLKYNSKDDMLEEIEQFVDIKMIYDAEILTHIPARYLYTNQKLFRDPGADYDGDEDDIIIGGKLMPFGSFDCSAYPMFFRKTTPADDITVDHIIYNDPATIVFWKDGTKTVVKKSPKEPYNKYNAFCAALAKKVYGNNSQVNRLVASGVDTSTKKKKEEKKSKTKFVRDEKGRWCSAPKTKKEKRK